MNADAQAWLNLVERYGGNGLALKIVGQTIHQAYNGDVTTFLADVTVRHGTVFGDIRRILDAQAERLAPMEFDVFTRLPVAREPISLAELSRDMAQSVGRSIVIEAVDTLRQRSLVERSEHAATVTLQSMVLGYVTDRLVETVADEITRGAPVVLIEQPLIKTQAKDYVRQTQERLIGAPILQRLNAQQGVEATERRLVELLDGWRGLPAAVQDCGPGNVVNLLRLLRGDLPVSRAPSVDTKLNVPTNAGWAMCSSARLCRFHVCRGVNVRSFSCLWMTSVDSSSMAVG